MPATKAAQATENLQEEVETLRKDMNEMMELLKSSGSDIKDELSDALEEKFAKYQTKTQNSVADLYEKGGEGLDDIGQKIKDNPLASLAIAFGAGYILSKVLSSGK